MRFAWVLAATLTVQFAINASRPLASYQAIGLGVSIEQLGLIATAFAVVGVLIAIPIGNAVDRSGSRRFVVGGSFLIAGACFAHALTESFLVIVALQLVFGAGLIVAAVGLQSLVAGLGDPDRSEWRFGMFTATVSIGQVIGPLVGGGLSEWAIAADLAPDNDPFGARAAFAALAAIVAVASFAALRLPAAPPRDPERIVAPIRLRGSVGSVMRSPSMLPAMWASTVVLCAIDVLAIYLPAIGIERGWSVGFVSLLLAVRAGASFAVRLSLQVVVDRFGRRWPLVIMGVGAAAAIATLVAPLPDAGAVAVMIVAGLCLGLGQPMTMAWVSRAAPAELRGTALSVRLAANRVGQMTIPLAIGVAAGVASTSVVFIILAALLLSSSAVVARSRLP